MTEFARSLADGSLTFADSIRDGELIRASFPAAPLPFPSAHEARAGVHFTASGVDYLAVAAGAGGARVYTWDPEEGAFSLLQVLNRTDASRGEVIDASALDVVHHTVPASLGSGAGGFVFVSNALDSLAAVSAYRYTPLPSGGPGGGVGFEWVGCLPNARVDSDGKRKMAGKLAAFDIGKL